MIPQDNGDLWVIEKADPIVFGKRASRFACTIFRADSLDLTQVSGPPA